MISKTKWDEFKTATFYKMKNYYYGNNYKSAVYSNQIVVSVVIIIPKSLL